MFQVAIEETSTRETLTSPEDALALAARLGVHIEVEDAEDGVYLLELPDIFEDIQSFIIGRYTIHIESV